MTTAYQFSTNIFAININYTSRISELVVYREKAVRVLTEKYITDYVLIEGQIKNNWQLLDEQEVYQNKTGNFQIDASEITINKHVTVVDHYIHINYEFTNKSANELKPRIFIYSQPDFNGNKRNDTALYYKQIKGIVHYESDIYLSISAGIDPVGYACHTVGDNFGRGAFLDENMQLSGNPVTTGHAESGILYEVKVPANGKATLNVCIAISKNLSEIDKLVARIDVLANLVKTSELNGPQEFRFLAISDKLELNAEQRARFAKLIKRTNQIIAGAFTPYGAIFAGLDSIGYKNEQAVDDYFYHWPRDAAIVFSTAIKNDLITKDQADKFFTYTAEAIFEPGFLHHRYTIEEHPSLGSSWYDYDEQNSKVKLPIQLDQTAFTLIAYADYLEKYKVKHPVFHQQLELLIKFLLTQITADLHEPCYDIWENHWGQFTATQVILIKTFRRMINLLEVFPYGISNPKELDEELSRARSMLVKGLKSHFVDQNSELYYRGRIQNEQGKGMIDSQADASLNYLWKFQIKGEKMEDLKETIDYLAAKLKRKNGYARYEHDEYLRQGNLESNPWYISTLWFAQYYLKIDDKVNAKEALLFVLDHMDSTGILPEMAHPETGFSLSAKPLIWSHAEVLNLLDLIS
jgi:GH15 family glucan-1,4-alpha-glucosidase